MRTPFRCGLVLAAILLPGTVMACLWDYDTLMMERSRFPDTLELITGKFLRHSPEFYEWRIQDRKAKLEGDASNLAWYDDLAVAYDKTGRHDLAIETILAKDKIKPGLYETEANLGTFYIHSGQLEKGVEHITKAIAINPDAHFGREKYQKALVEYVLSRREGDQLQLPLAQVKLIRYRDPDGKEVEEVESVQEDFAKFLAPENKRRPGDAELQAALKGIQGMMKFGHYDSPVLLEALGSLLATPQAFQYETSDAKRLAARAYLKASYEAKDEAAKSTYRLMAGQILDMQTKHPHTYNEISLEEVERDFKRELAEAEQWYAALREDELSWIRDGKDPELEFAKLYTAEPRVTEEDAWKANPVGTTVWTASLLGGGVVLAVVGLLVAWWLRLRLTAPPVVREG